MCDVGSVIECFCRSVRLSLPLACLLPASHSRCLSSAGNKYMANVGEANISLDTMFNDVLLQWPVFNHHTDITALICPRTGRYDSIVWMSEN